MYRLSLRWFSVEHGLSAVWVQQLWIGGELLCSMWDLPRPGIEPVFPALAGGFLTREALHGMFIGVNVKIFLGV